MERFSDKCEMSQFGKLNQDRICTVNDRTLENVVEQRDPGVQVNSSLNLATRVLRVVKTVWHACFHQSGHQDQECKKSSRGCCWDRRT